MRKISNQLKLFKDADLDIFIFLETFQIET